MGVPQSIGVLRCHSHGPASQHSSSHQSVLFQGSPTPPTATSVRIPESVTKETILVLSGPEIGSISL